MPRDEKTSLDRALATRLSWAAVHDNDGLQGVDEVQPVPPGHPAEALDERTRVSNAVQLLLASGNLRDATAVMLEAYGDMIYAYCFRTLRDRAQAEDISQQVFLEAQRDLERFRGRSSIASWLMGIAAHRCIDEIRRRRRQNDRFESSDDESMGALPDPASAPIERLEQARLVEALGVCLHELSPEVRATVLLRFQSDLTYEQMAPELDARADTLCARVARALRVLKECLEKKGWSP